MRAHIRLMRQTLVYWSTPVNDGEGGFTFADPVELACRWDVTQEVYIGSDGQEKRSKATVYTDQLLDLNGCLFLGTLDDLSSAEEGDPLTVSGALRIESHEGVQDLRGNTTVYRAWM